MQTLGSGLPTFEQTRRHPFRVPCCHPVSLHWSPCACSPFLWGKDAEPTPSGAQMCAQQVACFFTQVTSAFELYICYSPLGTKAGAISAVNKLMKWIRKEEDRLFILTPQTY